MSERRCILNVLRASFFCLSLMGLHNMSLTNVLRIFRVAQRRFTWSHLNHSAHLELFKNLCDHGTCSSIDFGSGSYFWFWWMDMNGRVIIIFWERKRFELNAVISISCMPVSRFKSPVLKSLLRNIKWGDMLELRSSKS